MSSSKLETSPPPSLSKRISVDVAAAVGSASAAAIFVSMIDQAVTMNSSGAATMKESLKQSFTKLFTRPHHFIGNRAYLAVAAVYSTTYIAANLTDTYCERKEIDVKMPKLATTSVINISMGVTKDSLFAIWFGNSGAAAGGLSAFPAASWAMFITRDVCTMAAGFILPKMASDIFYEQKYFTKKSTCDVVAQLSVPMICQAFLTPIHLTALDIYNHPGVSTAKRVEFVLKVLPESAALRCCRVGAVYGIAGISNIRIKNYFFEK